MIQYYVYVGAMSMDRLIKEGYKYQLLTPLSDLKNIL